MLRSDKCRVVHNKLAYLRTKSLIKSSYDESSSPASEKTTVSDLAGVGSEYYLLDRVMIA